MHTHAITDVTAGRFQTIQPDSSRPSILSRCIYSVCIVAAMVIASSTDARAEITRTGDGKEQIFELRQGKTIARVCPAQGANVFSIEVDGREFLRQPDNMSGVAGVSCGVPILYPTPNRVKGAKFSFDGQDVAWKPNAQGNFIHGLVNRHPWKIIGTNDTPESSSIRLQADFNGGSELQRLFPFPHTLNMTVEVAERRVKWTYEVDNSTGKRGIPFGFALHPYFSYQGSREQTFLTIPATHWMHSEHKLPSGQLVPAEELDFELGQPISLANTKFDDVFFGMQPQHETLIDFRAAKCAVEIATSDAFTHLVVWTPSAPYFGIESQTCSTDAHNLHAAGFEEAAHLQVCEPGKTATGWVEYIFTTDASDSPQPGKKH